MLLFSINREIIDVLFKLHCSSQDTAQYLRFAYPDVPLFIMLTPFLMWTSSNLSKKWKNWLNYMSLIEQPSYN
jgi:hypothetical protein